MDSGQSSGGQLLILYTSQDVHDDLLYCFDGAYRVARNLIS